MAEFLSLHLGTILVGALLLAGVIGIVADIIRKKRKGKCVSCDCGCAGCSGSCPGANCDTKN